MNTSITEISAVIARWMRLADDQTLPLPVRKTLLVVVEDLTTALQIDLPRDYAFSDASPNQLPQEQSSGEHVG